MTTLPVVEKFISIDGEGPRAGALAVFIRLAGCNLRCSYCDTAYALPMEAGVPETIEEIAGYAALSGLRHVTITGGEPLIHAGLIELVHALLRANCEINIETNGSLDFSYLQQRGIVISCDYKLPSSGMLRHNHLAGIRKLRPNDVLKFVASPEDFDEIRRALLELRPSCQVFISPIFGECRPIEIVNFLQELRADSRLRELAGRIRLQVQLHKIVWAPDARGV